MRALPLIFSIALSSQVCLTAVIPTPGAPVGRSNVVRGSAPQYSVVPLEPGDDGPGSGDSDDSGVGGDGGDSGGNNGGGSRGDQDGNGTVTVVQTITRTGDTTTDYITRNSDETITRVIPLTVISIVGMDGKGTTTVTVPAPTTVTVIPSVSKPTSSTQTPMSTTKYVKSTAIVIASTSSAASAASTPISSAVTPAFSTSIMTFATVTSVSSTSSTKTYDDGMWHTTYPAWNGTSAYRLRH